MRLFGPVALALCVALFASGDAAAFCVYNKIGQMRGDADIVAEVISGGSWRASIARGGSTCCSWEDARCNPSRRRDRMLTFRVESVQGGRAAPRPCTVEAQAGGWIHVMVEHIPASPTPIAQLKCVEFRYRR